MHQLKRPNYNKRVCISLSFVEIEIVRHFRYITCQIQYTIIVAIAHPFPVIAQISIFVAKFLSSTENMALAPAPALRHVLTIPALSFSQLFNPYLRCTNCSVGIELPPACASQQLNVV